MTTEGIVIAAQAATSPQVDPGLAGIIGAVITGIVALVGHFILRSKAQTERQASHVEGFKSLTDSLQSQINSMQEDLRSVHKELSEVKSANDKLSRENRHLRSDIHTKDEIIHSFTQWHQEWERWFKSLSELSIAPGIDPPPEYTWQMRKYLREVARSSRENQNRNGETNG